MRVPRIRKPRLMDIVRVNGHLHVVVSVEWPGSYADLEPLGNVLARSMIVGDTRQAITLADALVDAGWSPPA